MQDRHEEMQTLLDEKEKEVNGLKVDLEYCETLLADDKKGVKTLWQR